MAHPETKSRSLLSQESIREQANMLLRALMENSGENNPNVAEDLLIFLYQPQDNFVPSESAAKNSTCRSWAPLRDVVHALEVNPQQALQKHEYVETLVSYLRAIAAGVLILHKVH